MMQMLPTTLMVLCATIAVALGALHLVYTCRGVMLLPRDRDLQVRMQAVSPVITRQTTMWKAWVGFNASHSCGLLLFGAVYGYLALAHGSVLFDSVFLLLLGLALLLGYMFIARKYFFRVPFRAVAVATALYVLALIANWA